MQLIPLLLTLAFSQPAKMNPTSDSVPIKTVRLYKGDRKRLTIEKKIEVFTQATGRYWAYKFTKEADGTLSGMFCNVMADPALNQKRMDKIISQKRMDEVIEPFFEDCIIAESPNTISALYYCFTNYLDSCFKNAGNNAHYSYRLNLDSLLGKNTELSFSRKAELFAGVLVKGAMADINDTGEVVLYLPQRKIWESGIEDRFKTEANSIARLGCMYLLHSRAARKLGYQKIKISYITTLNLDENPEIWLEYSYGINDPLFADLNEW